MNTTVELLDRQVAFLLNQRDNASFLVQVAPFLRALRADDRLSSYLDDLRDELVRVIQVLEAVDAELVPELIRLKDELVQLRPEADGSGVRRPPPGGATPNLAARFAYQQTLAYFDERAGAEPEPVKHKAEGGKAGALLAVLQAKDKEYLRQEDRARREAAGARAAVAAARTAASSDEPAADEGAADVASVDKPDGPQRSDLDRWRTNVGNIDGGSDTRAGGFGFRYGPRRVSHCSSSKQPGEPWNRS